MTNDSEARQATSEPPKPDQTARTFTFNWRFGSPKASDAEPSGELEGPPQTYYEALSGRRDPQRELFVSARKWLNRGVNAIALAFPVIGLTIGFLSGGDLLTTLLLGFGGAVSA